MDWAQMCISQGGENGKDAGGWRAVQPAGDLPWKLETNQIFTKSLSNFLLVEEIHLVLLPLHLLT